MSTNYKLQQSSGEDLGKGWTCFSFVVDVGTIIAPSLSVLFEG